MAPYIDPLDMKVRKVAETTFHITRAIYGLFIIEYLNVMGEQPLYIFLLLQCM